MPPIQHADPDGWSRRARPGQGMPAGRRHVEDVLTLFKPQAAELTVAIPEQGIDPAWLARPLAELGLKSGGSFTRLRVETPAAWHWRTPDAAFLARLLREVEAPGQKI